MHQFDDVTTSYLLMISVKHWWPTSLENGADFRNLEWGPVSWTIALKPSPCPLHIYPTHTPFTLPSSDSKHCLQTGHCPPNGPPWHTLGTVSEPLMFLTFGGWAWDWHCDLLQGLGRWAEGSLAEVSWIWGAILSGRGRNWGHCVGQFCTHAGRAMHKNPAPSRLFATDPAGPSRGRTIRCAHAVQNVGYFGAVFLDTAVVFQPLLLFGQIW